MKRDWKKYNEKLVKRGELYLSLDFLKSWNRELMQMNKNKKGRPFEFPSSFIKFVSFIRSIFFLQYRQTEGFLRALSKHIAQIKVADYTTLWRRIAKTEFDIMIPESSKDVIVAIDATGMKVTNRGEWIREKWKRRRGWIKVHIAVDVETKELLAIEVTDERISDNKKFKDLLDQAQNNINGRIKRVLADGIHDTRDNFNSLKERKIESGIKIRKNASTRSRGSPYRAKCVRELKAIGEEEWKKKYGYGKRWAVESYFSAVKRIFGENLRATSFEGMVQEVKMKFLFYNMLAQAV